MVLPWCWVDGNKLTASSSVHISKQCLKMASSTSRCPLKSRGEASKRGHRKQVFWAVCSVTYEPGSVGVARDTRSPQHPRHTRASCSCSRCVPSWKWSCCASCLVQTQLTWGLLGVWLSCPTPGACPWAVGPLSGEQSGLM